MIKQIVIVFLFTLLGFSAVVYVSVAIAKKPVHIITPLSSSQFSLQNPPSTSLGGNITALSGDVFWESRTTSDFASIKSIQKVQQGEALKTSKKGAVTFAFADIATVTMLADSQVGIIQTLPASILFSQTAGIVTYEAQSSITPVSVRILDLLVTSSRGKVQLALTPKTQKISILLLDGSATLAYTDTKNTSRVVTLTRGGSAIFDNDAKTIQ